MDADGHPRVFASTSASTRTSDRVLSPVPGKTTNARPQNHSTKWSRWYAIVSSTRFVDMTCTTSYSFPFFFLFFFFFNLCVRCWFPAEPRNTLLIDKKKKKSLDHESTKMKRENIKSIFPESKRGRKKKNNLE